MPRPTLLERARLYVARMPVSVSGSGGHNAAFAVACALVKGFDLTMGESREVLAEWNRGCQPPWSERELEHKLAQADKVPDTDPRGYLIGDDNDPSTNPRASGGGRPALVQHPLPPKPEFDEVALRRFAKGWDEIVDLLWLANRSVLDPAVVTAETFLQLLYAHGEKVVVFTNQHTQGSLWPDEPLPPARQPLGTWFLAQPVDGRSRQIAGPKGPVMSRRSKESVSSFRYLVIESDDAPMRLWLGALVQLPLKIEAIYTSGKRSVHALVRVDAATKEAWDEIKLAMKTGLVVLGADPGALSAVRLTRLPGCFRAETGCWQKLLYFAPGAAQRPLMEAMVVRDVEQAWCARAADGVADGDESGGAWIEHGLGYYASRSPACRAALEKFKTEGMAV